MRNMEGDAPAQQLNSFFKNDHRAGAVDVVIAVQEHGFFLFDSAPQTRDRVRHSGEQIRIVQISQRGIKVPPSLRRIAKSASPQYSRGRTSQPERLPERRNSGGVRFLRNPPHKWLVPRKISTQ